MFNKLLVILLLIDAIVLVSAILLQSGKGGGMAASFGGASSSTDQFFGARQAGNLLTKASWWCGGIFIGLAFLLQISAARGRLPTSVLDKSFAQPKQTAPAPQSSAPAPNAPAVPLTPAPVAGDAKAGAKPAEPVKKP
jgi:preprotein translocase subunit SecG